MTQYGIQLNVAGHGSNSRDQLKQRETETHLFGQA